jgi:hypothetical protein
MRQRLLPGLVALCLLAVPAAVRAADPKPAEPTVIVRLESLQDLMADAKYLAAFFDQDNVVEQFGAILTTGKGAKALDGKKPIGLYGTPGPNGTDSSVVLMVPVADEKTFLDLLGGFKVKAEQDKDDKTLYTLTAEQAAQVPGYLRFANGYAYATALNKDNVAKSALLAPAAVLPAGQTGLLSLTLRLDRIDDKVKQLALQQLDLQLADARDRDFKGDTKAQGEFWKEAFKELSLQAKSVATDGQELTLKLVVDRKAEDVSLELALDGKSGSKLATNLASLGQAKSPFGGLSAADAAVQGNLNLALPADLVKALGPVIDESITKALEGEKDKAKREEAAKVLKVVEPTLKAGELDTAFVLRPPAGSGKYSTLVAAIRVKNGTDLDKTFRDVVKTLPQGDQDRIKFDAEKAGSVNVHRADAGKDLDENSKKTFGEGPSYFAFRSDAIFLSTGENALSAIKEAVAAQSKATPLVHAEVSMRGLVPTIAQQRNDTKGEVAKAAQDAFGKAKGNDTIALTLEGGKALKLRFDMKAATLKFFAALNKEAK